MIVRNPHRIKLELIREKGLELKPGSFLKLSGSPAVRQIAERFPENVADRLLLRGGKIGKIRSGFFRTDRLAENLVNLLLEEIGSGLKNVAVDSGSCNGV